MSDGPRIDPRLFPNCDRDGHRLVNCGGGVYRCRNCMTERVVIKGESPPQDGARGSSQGGEGG